MVTKTENAYNFSEFNSLAQNGVISAIEKINKDNKLPIIICVGSDLVLGDSLGPLTGTLLKNKGINAYVYGSLSSPITATEVTWVAQTIKRFHKNSFIIAIDAAVGNDEDVGMIKVTDKGIKPGIGVNKNLGEIGDAGIIGVVAKRSKNNDELFNKTRLGAVYKMASKIADALYDYLTVYKEPEKKEKCVTSGKVRIRKVY